MYRLDMRWHLATRIVRTAAVVAVLFANVIHGAAQPLPLELRDATLADYLNSGGTLADICGHGDGGASRGRHCDACLLKIPALLPAPSVSARDHCPAPVSGTFPARQPSLRVSAACRNNLPRAPPVQSVVLV